MEEVRGSIPLSSTTQPQVRRPGVLSFSCSAWLGERRQHLGVSVAVDGALSFRRSRTRRSQEPLAGWSGAPAQRWVTPERLPWGGLWHAEPAGRHACRDKRPRRTSTLLRCPGGCFRSFVRRRRPGSRFGSLGSGTDGSTSQRAPRPACSCCRFPRGRDGRRPYGSQPLQFAGRRGLGRGSRQLRQSPLPSPVSVGHGSGIEKARVLYPVMAQRGMERPTLACAVSSASREG